MATKWKNYSRAWYIKLIAWILVLVCTVGTITSVWYGIVKYDDFGDIDTREYMQRETFRYDVKEYTNAVLQILLYENMSKAYTKEIVDAQMKNAYLIWKDAEGEVSFYSYQIALDSFELVEKAYINYTYSDEYYNARVNEEYDDVQTADTEENSTSVQQSIEVPTKDLSYKAFKEANPDLRANIEKCMELNQNREYQKSKYIIENSDVFTYSVSKNGVKKEENDWKLIRETYITHHYPFYIFYENGKETSNKDYNGSRIKNTADAIDYFLYMEAPSYDLPFGEAIANSDGSLIGTDDPKEVYNTWLKENMEQILKQYKIAVGIEYQTLAQKQENMEDSVQASKYILFSAVIMMVVLCFSVLYLIVTTGRSPKDQEVHLNWIDTIWSEIQGVALISVAGVAMLLLRYMVSGYYYTTDINGNDIEVRRNYLMSTFGEPMAMFIVALIVSLGTIVVETVILSQVGRLKARKWLDGFVCIRFIRSIWRKIWNIFYSIWTGGRIMTRMALLAVIVPILSATWFGLPFVIAFLIFFGHRYVKDFESLQEGVKKIRKGDLNYQIQTENESVIREVAEDVNAISEGLKNAIDSEIRSERMKTELISNVSHDIKTPLTSIITYVDLLKKEEIENEMAKEYILVLENKANRLKVLTDDLFEAAKASSGDMPVHLEKVNMQSFVQQSLGEFEDKFQEVGITMRVMMTEEPLYITADGRLMWRVISNLLNNVVKYSQTGSRVYLEVEEDTKDEQVIMTLKNISAYELNVSAKELMERFTRGDESRSTEGSGLGLSIANSLIELQNGRFEISIDGDLFKVKITMPVYRETLREG